MLGGQIYQIHIIEATKLNGSAIIFIIIIY